MDHPIIIAYLLLLTVGCLWFAGAHYLDRKHEQKVEEIRKRIA